MLTCYAYCSIDNSKVQEAPETPAPVFALRAFKSALFGTPGAEGEDESVLRAKEEAANRLRNQSDSRKAPATEHAGNDTATKKTETGLGGNTMTSPTKSILLTPGTTSNRRKTVSFGDAVVDNERKQDSPTKSSSKTPVNLTGNSSSPWTFGSSDGKNKPRSKLTQALMDSRDTPSKDPGPMQAPKPDVGRSSESAPRQTQPPTTTTTKNDDNDETINIEEPRSQSGKYWKTEFDNYRTRTDKEIRRLVQYRSVAKDYARKKDEEAVRLADKLKQEEAKVVEMERHVSQLASTMVAEGGKANKEQLIQDLTKQTALALQYKHRVSILRKSLEEHGVVSSEIDDLKEQPDGNGPSDKTAEELRKTQQALGEANDKIQEMRSQRSDLSKLEGLAQSSQQKASELEKENAAMKQNLARVKSEMTKYEGRRKEKEARLKQREAKLETRIQEYRERLKAASQQHRDSQKSLKECYNEERQHMQEQIERLKLTIATLERLPDIKPNNCRRARSPRKDYTGVQVYDFGQSSPQKGVCDDETEDIDEPPSPSPRSKERSYRHLRNVTDDPLDLKRAAQAMGIEEDDDGDDPLIYMEEHSPRKIQQDRRFHRTTHDESDTNLPSSPPDLSSIQPSCYRAVSASTKPDYDRDNHRTYVPSRTHANTVSSRGRLEEGQKTRTPQPRRRSPTKYGLDALSGLPTLQVSGNTLKQRNGLKESQRDSIPMDRMLAAQARLKRKGAGRKVQEDGKENIKAV